MVKEITNANDVHLNVGNTVKVPVSSFEINRTEDSDTIHGSGHAEPRGYTRGNIDYEVSIECEGDVTEVMLDVVETAEGGRSKEVEIIATSPHFKWTVRGVLFTDETYGGDDGDVVSYSADGIAVSVEREDLGGSDL